MDFGAVLLKHLRLIFFIMPIEKSWPIRSKLVEIEEPTFGYLKSFIFWNYSVQFPMSMWGWVEREKGGVRGLHNISSVSSFLILTRTSTHCPRSRCSRQWVDQVCPRCFPSSLWVSFFLSKFFFPQFLLIIASTKTRNFGKVSFSQIVFEIIFSRCICSYGYSWISQCLTLILILFR